MVAIYDSAIVVAIVAYLTVAPFTKVEESFSIQAIHDIVTYGIKDISNYDHIEFPGAVPRSFIGPLVTSGIIKPILWILPDNPSKMDGQLLARGVLGLANAFGFIVLKNSLLKTMKQRKANEKDDVFKGKYLGIWYGLFQITEFNLNFYATRTLPNFFALPFTNYAFSQILSGSYNSGISLLAFTSVVFRIEVVALTLATGLFLFLAKRVTIFQLVKAGLIGGIIGSASSLVIDSYFWGRAVVPELESFIFNVLEGKSSEWGTHPFHLYFTRSLPLVYLPYSIPLLGFIFSLKSAASNETLKLITFSSFLYVTLLSFQPHKEWRFIVYVYPVFNLAAASGASFITWKASKSFFFKLLVLGSFAGAISSLFISMTFALISSMNYPGGVALNTLHEELLYRTLREPYSKNITIHFDVATAMTGVTKFNELSEISGINIFYDKTEDSNRLEHLWDTFDFLITEIDLEGEPTNIVPSSTEYTWKHIDTTFAFDGVNVNAVKNFEIEKFLQSLFYEQRSKSFKTILYPFFSFKTALFTYEKVPVFHPPLNEAI